MALLTSNLEGFPVQAFFSICILCLTSMCIYRLYFHPLSGVPGPRLAAITMYYEAFYNLIGHDGRYIFKVEQLHKKHGPIVRISPNAVSIKDPEFFNKVHYAGSHFEKDPGTYDAFGFGDSIFTTQSNTLHAQRRAPIKDFFARRNILGLEGGINKTISKLCQRIDKAINEKSTFDIQNGLRATSMDMSTRHAFDFSFNMLDQEDLGRSMSKDGQTRLRDFWVVKYFPITPIVYPWLPSSIANRLLPGVQSLKDLKQLCHVRLNQVKESGAAGTPLGKQTSIFHHLLSPENPKGEVLSDDDRVENGATFFAAGLETLSYTLIMTTFGVLSNPDVLEKLYKELQAEFPDPNEELSLVKLEGLPYLNAVVKEGLRQAPGAIGYIPRLTPEGGIVYDVHNLPKGTVVSTSIYYMHYDENHFPEPEKFDPERWLGADSKLLEKYLNPFGRGQRACVGMSLAYCELYLVIGTVFRRYSMQLQGNSWDDVKPTRDYFSGFPAKSARDLIVIAERRAT